MEPLAQGVAVYQYRFSHLISMTAEEEYGGTMMKRKSVTATAPCARALRVVGLSIAPGVAGH